MFWILFASIIIQSGMGASFKQFGVEWGVFMIGCICTSISFLRRGLWDYYTKPCIKTYLLYSIASTIILVGLFSVIKYTTVDYFSRNIQYLMISIGIFSATIFVLVFITMYLSGQYTIKKQKQLETKYDE